VAWLSADGEIDILDVQTVADRLRDRPPDAPPPVVCHGPATARRLDLPRLACADLLELFAFVHPARFCVPTPRGLAEACGLDTPHGLEAETQALHGVLCRLLDDLACLNEPKGREAADQYRMLAALAWCFARAGWSWGPFATAALGVEAAADAGRRAPEAFAVWRRLAEISEHAPEPPPGNEPVAEDEARDRLAELLARDDGSGIVAERRTAQAEFAAAASGAFRPRMSPEAPEMVLAEAGTGVGKTLGYVAPATVWAEKNKGAVWISTYTRNLQHQIDRELTRLYPERQVHSRKVVVRKGRENYLCLLNLEELVQASTGQLALQGGGAGRAGDSMHPVVALGLMVRWVAETRDGDLTGGDLPGWLPELLGGGRTVALADRRGECIYSACPHYNRCFVERSVRRARRADIVVANHALTMIQAAIGNDEDARRPTRYVFDEGHHLFDAADSAFSGHLTGREGRDLRRWLLGAETEGRRGGSRARGLQRRLEDLVAGDVPAQKLVEEATRAARVLPSEGWLQRIGSNLPQGAAEAFLQLVHDQVFARTSDRQGPYSLETETGEPIPGLLDAAQALDAALEMLARPMMALCRRFTERLDDEADELDTPTRLRLEAMIRSLKRRAMAGVENWRSMLQTLGQPVPEQFVDWFAVDRIDNRILDVGMHRHWVDPTEPFADFVLKPAQGVLVTSATLTDSLGEAGADGVDWLAAEARTGAVHLPVPAIRARADSPFDYGSQTRVLVVTDVRKDDLDQVSAAYRELIKAAGGGALGLFTAISRLRGVHRRIAAPLEAAGLPLLAQHVDGMGVQSLIEIFRAEEDACLLGTDAVRDGVDVPGRSLRLIVFDRVPWPRPDILHRARRERFGGRQYDDRLTRLRLKQAFGRLVRRADDRGLFVLLDPMMPTRLTTAFPAAVSVERVGLAAAVDAVSSFLWIE